MAMDDEKMISTFIANIQDTFEQINGKKNKLMVKNISKKGF